MVSCDKINSRNCQRNWLYTRRIFNIKSKTISRVPAVRISKKHYQFCFLLSALIPALISPIVGCCYLVVITSVLGLIEQNYLDDDPVWLIRSNFIDSSTDLIAHNALIKVNLWNRERYCWRFWHKYHELQVVHLGITLSGLFFSIHI